MTAVPDAAPSRPVLELTDVEAGYGEVLVLQGVHMAVRQGEVVCIVGPNGAGKSTVLKAVLGLLKPRRGEIRLDGRNIAGLSPHLVVRQGVGYVPQGRIVFPAMTVLENLEMGGFSVAHRKEEFQRRLQWILELFPRLRERLTQLAGSMSGGEQQMLAIGRALMLQPRVVLMDEPSLGLSPANVTIVFHTIMQLKAMGITMVLVEQNAAQALAISDRGYVLDMGKNRFEGPGRELLADPRIRALYLGGG